MRALAFALRLLARWDVRVLGATPLGLVFRRAPRPSRPAAVPASSDRSLRVELRPRIELTLVRSLPRPAAAPAREPGTERILSGRENLVLRAPAAAATERMVERVLARGVRVERTATATAVERQLRAPSPLALPGGAALELVVRQAQTAAPATRLAPPAGESEPPARLRPAIRDAASEALRDADVSRLADSVIATLDHRLIAQAERAGTV